MFTAPEGEISSPSEYGSYPPNHDCHWVIVGSPGEVIQLTFTTFKVEYHNACEFDYVAVYDNSSALKGGGLMGKYVRLLLFFVTQEYINYIVRSAIGRIPN